MTELVGIQRAVVVLKYWPNSGILLQPGYELLAVFSGWAEDGEDQIGRVYAYAKGFMRG